jgi:uncharacterized Zn finger protein (UPF0148 family)
MFEDLISEIERLNGLSVSVPMECDEKGYIDKQCPSEKCTFIFKVNREDWINIFKDEAVWCPLCRHEAPANQWFTSEHAEHAKAEALSLVRGRIDNALRSGVEQFNHSQPKNSLISMSMEVQGSIKRTHIIPAQAAEAMQLEITCEKCNSRFAVIGSAFFCPACGYNSVKQTYSDSLRKIKAKRDNASLIRSDLSKSIGKDEAELIYRSLRETCLSDGVVAFQKYCEGLYATFGETSFNAFQRIEEGSRLWQEAIHKSYSDWLTDEELAILKILYQKRHIFAHNEGIVDAKYIKKSGDISYKEGQRVVVSDQDINQLLCYLEKLGFGLKEACENV